jgi:hypothetical protein
MLLSNGNDLSVIVEGASVEIAGLKQDHRCGAGRSFKRSAQDISRDPLVPV